MEGEHNASGGLDGEDKSAAAKASKYTPAHGNFADQVGVQKRCSATPQWRTKLYG